MDGAKVPGLADAHVDRNKSWSLAEVARDQRFTQGGPQIKVAKWRANDICRRAAAIHSRWRERWTLGKEPITIRVLPGRNIERSS